MESVHRITLTALLTSTYYRTESPCQLHNHAACMGCLDSMIRLGLLTLTWMQAREAGRDTMQSPVISKFLVLLVL